MNFLTKNIAVRASDERVYYRYMLKASVSDVFRHGALYPMHKSTGILHHSKTMWEETEIYS